MQVYPAPGTRCECEPIRGNNMTRPTLLRTSSSPWQLVACVVLLTFEKLATGESEFENCMEGCDILFSNCIRESCTARAWPLPIPKKCVDERSSCVDQCTTAYTRR
ncbi:hypothetical protein NP493_364g01033 [Ridgeia piscesae]|uniref:Uncharacterized protein n=1 Tax=Ridgeia piscesae TaxID=27915 RepID=A0AAD9L2H4_RIDPI|nr:hypothetical protein NP493_364g01033 [Ridgeia piscesae]